MNDRDFLGGATPDLRLAFYPDIDPTIDFPTAKEPALTSWQKAGWWAMAIALPWLFIGIGVAVGIGIGWWLWGRS